MDNGLNTIEFYSGDISANFATSPNPQANGGAQDNGATWGYAADNAINHIRKSEELQDLRKLLREDLWKLLRDEEDVHNEQSTSDTVA